MTDDQIFFKHREKLLEHNKIAYNVWPLVGAVTKFLWGGQYVPMMIQQTFVSMHKVLHYQFWSQSEPI